MKLVPKIPFTVVVHYNPDTLKMSVHSRYGETDVTDKNVISLVSFQCDSLRRGEWAAACYSTPHGYDYSAIQAVESNGHIVQKSLSQRDLGIAEAMMTAMLISEGYLREIEDEKPVDDDD